MKILSLALYQIGDEEKNQHLLIIESNQEASRLFQIKNERSNERAKFQTTRVEDFMLRSVKDHHYILLLVIDRFMLVSDQSLETLFKELIDKMTKSGIWEGKPFQDVKLAKRFQKDFLSFVEEKSHLVKVDKVAKAQ